MKKIMCAALYFLSFAAVAAQCRTPDPESLRQTWQMFRAMALKEQPAEVERFYAFPIRLLTHYDGDKPATISKAIFRKNYKPLFVKNLADEETALHHALRKTSGNEFIPAPFLQADQCKLMGAVRIEDYQFVFDKTRGWLIKSIYYGSDFEVMKDDQLDKISQ